MTTIGMEEEFVFLDPASLTPVDLGPDALDALGHQGGDEGHGGHEGSVMPEFFRSQIEFASPVCTTLDEAHAALVGFRRRVDGWAATRGAVAAGVGLPFRVVTHAEISDSARYREIATRFGRIVPDHQLNGLHVHVGMDNRDAAVRAINRLRPWLPVLLALSANSPFWQGADTGFDSWRAIHSRRWTTHGIPPAFRDADDYERRTAALHGIGGTSDAGTLNWVARPSEKYPTVEVRVFDAQLDAKSSTALCGLVRALVSNVAVVPDPADHAPEAELLDAAFWHAAHNGLATDLADPRTHRLRPAEQVVDALLDAATPGLAKHGDAERVGMAVEEILRHGNGATRQRRALARGGIAAIARLFHEADASPRD